MPHTITPTTPVAPRQHCADMPPAPVTHGHDGFTCADVESLLAETQHEVARLQALIEQQQRRLEVIQAEKRVAIDEAVSYRHQA